MSTGITTKLTFQELTNGDIILSQAFQENHKTHVPAWSIIKKS